MWWTVAGLLATVGYFTLPQGSLAASLVYDGLGAAAAAVMLAVARGRLTWLLFAAGTLLWAGGDAVYSYYVHRLHQDPFPSVADALYLAAYPLLAAGVFGLVRQRAGRSRAAVLDASIVATGVGLVLWTFVMQPIAHDGSVGVAARVVALAYPAFDVLLLAMLARLFVSGAVRDTGIRLLAASFAVLTCADVAYSVFTAYTSYDGGLFDAGWLLSYVLWAAAALHPSSKTPAKRADTGEDGLRFGWVRLLTLASSSLLAPGVLLVQGVTQPRDIDWLAIGACAVVLFLLVVVRMAGLVGQVQAGRPAQRPGMRDDLTGLANRRELEELHPRGAGLGRPAVALHRPRRLQGHQRPARPRRRRPAAHRGRRAARAAACGPATRSPASAATSSRVLLPAPARRRRRRASPSSPTRCTQPVLAGGHELLVQASIGVAPAHRRPRPVELLRRADVAMYAAKDRARPPASPTTRSSTSTRRRARPARRRAARRPSTHGQFRLLYQPIVGLPTAQTVGVEALVRWHHPHARAARARRLHPGRRTHRPDRPSSAPGSCARRAARPPAGAPRARRAAPERVSVNVSARQLPEPDFAGAVAGALADDRPRPATASPSRSPRRRSSAAAAPGGRCTRLHALGVQHRPGRLRHRPLVARPAAHLPRRRAQGRQVLRRRHHRPGWTRVIADALIDISDGLRLRAVAEGVETAAQADELYGSATATPRATTSAARAGFRCSQTVSTSLPRRAPASSRWCAAAASARGRVPATRLTRPARSTSASCARSGVTCTMPTRAARSGCGAEKSVTATKTPPSRTAAMASGTDAALSTRSNDPAPLGRPSPRCSAPESVGETDIEHIMAARAACERQAQSASAASTRGHPGRSSGRNRSADDAGMAGSTMDRDALLPP